MSIFGTLVTDQVGVQSMQINNLELLNIGNISGITGGDENDNEASSVETTVLIGAVATGLGVFLLTLTWVIAFQRRQHARALAHARLEEDLDHSGSFRPRQISSYSRRYDDDSDGASHYYETTIIPIRSCRDDGGLDSKANLSFGNSVSFMDETDTVPFDEADESFWTNHTRDRVHLCSAATCEVCEQRRQQGILLFDSSPLQAQMLSRTGRAPSNPERWFVSEDTVQL
jgi:hypothetical protein